MKKIKIFNHIPIDLGYDDIPTSQVCNIRLYHVNTNTTLPSITSVLSAKEKPELEEWKRSLGEEQARIETERCSTRGTALHDLAEKYLKGIFVDLNTVDATAVRLFNQIKNKLNRIDNIIVQEQALFSSVLGVAGRVDCIAEYDGVLSVIDFKTANNLKNEHQIYDYFLQETFYLLALLELTGIEAQQIVTIIGVEKGTPLVFKKNPKPYILPLVKRIEEFKRTFYNE